MAAFLRPSAAHIWVHCSAYPSVAVSMPQPDSPETMEGAAAHWVAAQCLLAYQQSAGGPGGLAPHEYVGQSADNGVIVTDAMADSAAVYVRDVLQHCQGHGRLQHITVERPLPGLVITHGGGTPDCIDVDLGRRVITCWDFKHGRREVQAYGNWQGICYMLEAFAQAIPVTPGLHDEQWEFDFRVVQPRVWRNSGPVQSWRGRMSTLRGYANQLLFAEAAAVSGTPTITGGDHCRDCPAVGTCSGARAYCYAAAEVAGRPYELDAMGGQALRTEWDYLKSAYKTVEARIAAIGEQLTHMVQQGDTSAGLVLQTEPGRLGWTVPAAVAVAAGQQLGLDWQKRDAVTPSQAIDRAPKEQRELVRAIVGQMASRPATSPKLVPVENSRTAGAFLSNPSVE